MEPSVVEERLLLELNGRSEKGDVGGDDGAVHSEDFAKLLGVEHVAIVGVIKSLQAHELIDVQEQDCKRCTVTEEGESYAADGSPEAQVFRKVPADGIAMNELKGLVGKVYDIGFKQAMQSKWISIQKGAVTTVHRKVETIQDKVQEILVGVKKGLEFSEKEMEPLRKRKLISVQPYKVYVLRKGPKFALKKTKPATDLTRDMLASGAWKTQEFKMYNFNALGIPTAGGHLHPLLKVRAQFQKIFLEMGFEEMPTNNFVESSFWNFDALFQPQMHPARDSHDTFFLAEPATARSFPEDYLERVKNVHERGGYGSTGYGYDWKRSEAAKNLLRTHTTAVSSRMLYKLAQDGFQPKKYFSIDRVFRNEAVDKTHLAEFHQIEGLVCDRGLTLGDLIGMLNEFFGRLGIKKLRFKPAYNPYTEPSMEIFSYHETFQKWVEIGNSGMFRPEMLLPMGLPSDVSVIAWGLSLERLILR
ncbi:hypothetical protein CBR_g23301 [Chara braunii]|uniref:phenylalanine--tRNA ligase n=1 Tax=Chara braunii TaxID=69332 RepID=A0A388L3U0_CHABU|nr:hypothetical protein CBR_g23301 [Chara braunii]|eukprot:GBG76970.1 hypothetical protein CBR_g23301 [Chara braunii]